MITPTHMRQRSHSLHSQPNVTSPPLVHYRCAICLEHKHGTPDLLPCCGTASSSIQYCPLCIDFLFMSKSKSHELLSPDLVFTTLAKCPTCACLLSKFRETGTIFSVERGQCKECKLQNCVLVSEKRCELCSFPELWASERLRRAMVQDCYWQVYTLQKILAVVKPYKKGIVAVMGVGLLLTAMIRSWWKWLALGVCSVLYVAAVILGTISVVIPEHQLFGYFGV